MMRGVVYAPGGATFWCFGRRIALCGLLLGATFCAPARATEPDAQQLATQDLLIVVLDENGVAVPAARLTLTG